MARIYASGALLDPSIINMATNAMNERIRQDRETRRPVVEAIQNAVTTVGNSFDDWRKRQYEEDLGRQRYAYLKRVTPEEYMSDPVWKAAMHEFARTGSSTPITSYMLGKQAKEEAARVKQEAKEEKELQKKRDWELGVEAAREQYAKLSKDMANAISEGRNQDAEISRNALRALEKKWTKEGEESPFGNTALEMEDALMQERDAKKSMAAHKKMEADESLALRNFIDAEFIKDRAVKDKNEQAFLTSIINTAKLTDDDKKVLLDKVKGPTLTERHNKAAEDASVSNTGKVTGENLEKKKKADAALAKLNAGTRLLPAEATAFLEVYGKDAEKKALYDKVKGGK